ncbi:membrane-associated protein, putative [Bodo saltans]|uniref:Membrane-associated protein, putative n=1 Tax=Bodo saltans TaxID=75058 RepID=A0A0S4J8B9_BODSA|nr:membrane-associated protein, putative [Bodo saltans]|eukprot:CUG86130.1 membrane-associated protein, putative [Bodo saltans]
MKSHCIMVAQFVVFVSLLLVALVNVNARVRPVVAVSSPDETAIVVSPHSENQLRENLQTAATSPVDQFTGDHFMDLKKAFEASCSTNNGISKLRQSPHFRRDFISSKLPPGVTPFVWRAGPVCVNDAGQVVSWTSQTPKPFNSLRMDSSLQFSESAKWLTYNADAEARFADLYQRDLLKMHPAVGLIMFGRWASINVFHFTADVLTSAAAFLSAFPEVRNAPHAGALIHETHFVQGFESNKSLCRSCIEGMHATNYDAGLSIPGQRQNVSEPIFLSRGGDGFLDGAGAHCFCSAVLTTPMSQRLRRTFNTSVALHEGIWLIRRRLADHFGIAPFGTVVPLVALLSSPVWKRSAADCSGPRLLMILRVKNRHFAMVSNISHLANSLGYCVTTVAFETLSSADQFGAARYADVMLGMHGAAMTYLYMMDPMNHCRSVIELLPWAAWSKVRHNCEFGDLCNITVDQIEANGVHFGPSVRQRKVQKRLLRQAHKNIHELPGFNDQTAFHPLSKIRDALLAAKRRWMSCHV